MKKFRALIIVVVVILVVGSVIGILAATTDKLDGVKDKLHISQHEATVQVINE